MKAFDKWLFSQRPRPEPIQAARKESWKATLAWERAEFHPGDRANMILEENEKELENK